MKLFLYVKYLVCGCTRSELKIWFPTSLHWVLLTQLKIQPELHYGDPDCPVTVRDDFPKTEELLFEVELFNFGAAKVHHQELPSKLLSTY